MMLRLALLIPLVWPLATVGQTITSPNVQLYAGNQFNVLAYGATGNGVTDDAAAIQAAVTAGIASAKAFSLVFPCGAYVVSANISGSLASSQAMEIAGSSVACSVIKFSGVGTDLFTFTLNPGATVFAGPVSVHDISFQATAAAGVGLTMTSTQASSVTPEFTHLRFNYTSTNSFSSGMILTNLSSATFSDVQVWSPNTTGAGIQIDGNATFPIINMSFNQIYGKGWGAAILVGNGTDAYAQGIQIVNSRFLAGVSCVKWYQGAGSLADWLTFNGSHCNPGTGAGIGLDLNGVLDANISNNYFLLGSGGTAVKIAPAAGDFIGGNIIVANGLTNVIGVNAVGTTGNLSVIGNVLWGFNASGDSPITAAAGTVNTVVQGNVCKTCSATFVNTNGSNAAVIQWGNVEGAAMTGAGYASVRQITGSSTTTNTSSTADNAVVWRSSSANPKAQTIVGCTAQFTSLMITIKDGQRTAAANNITVTPSSGTIDGGASVVISTNGGWITAVCDGTSTDWLVISKG